MKTSAHLKNNLEEKKILKIIFTIFALAFFFAQGIFAQTTVNPKVVVTVPRPPEPPRRTERRLPHPADIPAEKSIRANSRVSVSLCVSEGSVKINGWDRSEIRAFVSGGGGVGFLVRGKDSQTSEPNLVKVLSYDAENKREAETNECLSGGSIELDVPRGAYVDLSGQETEISIRSIGKVRVSNDAGSIALSEIARGINARTYEGDITVEKSSGAMTLNSTNGNVVAIETENNDVGDILSAKTISGSITLQQVAQKQIEAGSNTGSIRFDGRFESGGQYTFATTTGAINLLIPADSSVKVEAFYGGNFQSEIAIKELTKDISPSVQKIVGVMGAGDAFLSLKNIGGAISIRKK